MGENIYTNTSDKGLITKIYKEFTKLTPKKTTQLKNSTKNLKALQGELSAIDNSFKNLQIS